MTGSGAGAGTAGEGRSRATGRVSAFDAYVGLGQVAPDDGGEPVMFHCVEIADGTRTIEIGTAVDYAPTRKFGRVEAFDLRPVDPQQL